MKKIFFLGLLLNPFVMYSDISKIKIYPSGITVNFNAPPKTIVVEKSVKKPWYKKNTAPIEPAIISTDKFKKFIRVINSIKHSEDTTLKLVFYDNINEVISEEVITNSIKPSPKHIFFIDRNSDRNFQGVLDIYHIPENAQYFLIGFFNKDNIRISTVSHPDFGKDNKIQILDYNKLSPNRPTMLQIELLGQKQNILTRIGAFYFVK